MKSFDLSRFSSPPFGSRILTSLLSLFSAPPEPTLPGRMVGTKKGLKADKSLTARREVKTCEGYRKKCAGFEVWIKKLSNLLKNKEIDLRVINEVVFEDIKKSPKMVSEKYRF